jgi:signal transduction histidine kinase
VDRKGTFPDLSMSWNFEAVNAFLALLAVAVNFTFAAMVILRSSRNRIYNTFTLICISLIVWNFGDFMVYASGHELWPKSGMGSPSLWKYYSSSGSAMAVAFLFHFICALERNIVKRIGWILAAYIGALFFAVSSPMALHSDRVAAFVDGDAWNILFMLVLLPFIIFGVVILVKGLINAGTREERNRWAFTLTAILITAIAGLTDLVQKLEFPIPPLGHLGSVVGPTFLAIGVFRHKEVFDVLTRTRRKLEAMNEIAAGIAHEIRNPLTAIKGAVSLQDWEIEGGNLDEARRYQWIIKDEVQRLDAVLAGFMDFTKPIKLEKQRMCVSDLVRRTLEVASLEPDMIGLYLNAADDLPECEIDPTLMRQVIINLIRNAVDACGQKGRLSIAIDWVPPQVQIVFSDNGPGFDSQQLGRVMEPFFTTKKDGMGIGLSMCRRIVTAHGGKIKAGNSPQGGAMIIVSLNPATG